MSRARSSSNREQAPPPGLGAVRGHRWRSTLQLLFGLAVCIQPTIGLRGPHHPKSTVSHHHYVPVKSVKLTQDEQLLHDTAHLVEDIGSLAEQIDVSNLSAQEQEFYYFRLHDIDNNIKLDGLEFVHAIQHIKHGEDTLGNADQTNEIGHDDQEDPMLDAVEIIDRMLEEDDLDNDGYLSYIEYVLGKRKD